MPFAHARVAGRPGRGRAVTVALAAGRHVGARATGIVDAGLVSFSAEWVAPLLGPALEGDADYVSPIYSRAVTEGTLTTNLLGPIRLTAALLPHLVKQPRAAIMTVSSGLAFVPLAMTPTYCATKAAIHSYSQSLRYQLKDTRVQVLELIPPYVQTELMGPRQANDPSAMPLKDFIAETMNILKTSPDATEICVERVRRLRFAEANGGYDSFFKKFNDELTAARTR